MHEDKPRLTSMAIIIFLALGYFLCRMRDLFVRENWITYKYIYINGFHIHHYYIGIILLILGLILLLYHHGQQNYHVCSSIFGIGTGLVLDKAQKVTNLRVGHFDPIFILILIAVAIPFGGYLSLKFNNLNAIFKRTHKDN